MNYQRFSQARLVFLTPSFFCLRARSVGNNWVSSYRISSHFCSHFTSLLKSCSVGATPGHTNLDELELTEDTHTRAKCQQTSDDTCDTSARASTVIKSRPHNMRRRGVEPPFERLLASPPSHGLGLDPIPVVCEQANTCELCTHFWEVFDPS